jgi:hypothetical protein
MEAGSAAADKKKTPADLSLVVTFLNFLSLDGRGLR